MKSKIWKSVAAGMAVLLTGIIVGTVVMNSAIEAEAADTFLGIQNLITEVSNNYQQNQEKYTILEIVPDREAAEIGYLFDGCEPALSEWNDTQKRWISWRERLAACADAEERKKLIDGDGTPDSGLKKALENYYTRIGLTSATVPVEIVSADYVETDFPTEGYEQIDIPGVEMRGYFAEITSRNEGTAGYQLAFTKAVLGSDTFEPGRYYKVKTELQIVGDSESSINATTQIRESEIDSRSYVYIKNSLGEYECLGTWDSLQVASFSLSADEEDIITEEETVDESAESTEEESTEEESTEEESTEESTEEESTEESTGQETIEEAVILPTLDTAPVSGEITILNPDDISGNEISNSDDSSELSEELLPQDEANMLAGFSVRAASVPTEQNVYVVTFEAAEANDSQLYVVDDIQRGNYTVDDPAKCNYGFYEFVKMDSYATYTLNAETIYCKNTFTNQEWFKKYVLNMAEDEYGAFPVEVISYTPGELNDLLAVEGGRLPDFDFLYINSGKSAEWVYSATADEPNKKSGDLSSEVSRQLFAKIQENALPCIIDGNVLFVKESAGIILNEDLKNTQIFKLCTLFAQDSLESIVVDLATLGESQLEAYLETLAVGHETGNFSTNQVYVYLGTHSIINEDFGVSTIYQEGNGEIPVGFRKVLDEIELENLYREADKSNNYGQLSTNISQATVVRHIMNYQNRRNIETTKHINVLEIQPARTQNGKPELTKDQIKSWAPSVEVDNIDTMTTAEFIGRIEKLNENYDLIYFGASLYQMNTRRFPENAVNQEPGIGSTVFNDTNMDGLIYFHTGDLRGVSMQLSGMLDSDYIGKIGENRNNNLYYYTLARYSGNDITKEKKEALLSFLDGSYPIVVADAFFEAPVTVYEDSYYKKAAIDLKEGSYDVNDLRQLGIGNDQISSIRVKEGYEVQIFEHGWCNGATITFDENVDNLVNVPFSDSSSANWNDQISSLIVRKKEGVEAVRRINTDHIDSSSYVYDFITEAQQKGYTNLYAYSDITEDSELFQFYLNRPKVVLSDYSANGTFQDGTYYIQPDVKGKYILQYVFTINNEGAATADTRYQCNLYIDVNADGKFSSSENIADIILTQGGNRVSANELYAGREYVLTREVPQGYKGVLPWRVEISQVNNDDIYTSYKGYTKLEKQEKETLKILQIGRDKLDWPEPDFWGYGAEYLFNLEERIENPNDMFHILIYGGTYNDVTYEGISDDFEIDVTYKTISQFEAEYNNNNDYLKEFNMLILGFSDTYGDFSGNAQSGPMGAVVDFINSGKSVLLSHDTTSYFNYQKDKWGNYDRTDSGALKRGYWNRQEDYWGNTTTGPFEYHNAYSINTYIRTLVGMDRYGVMQLGAVARGVEYSSSSSEWSVLQASIKDKAYTPKSNKSATVAQTQGYTYTVINSKDHAPGRDGEEITVFSSNQIPGGFQNQYSNLRYENVEYSDNLSDFGQITNANGEVKNAMVTLVNRGQITDYPYRLPEQFDVSATHGQYYQLDFTADDDGDGQSDLVVWYCLGKRMNGGNEKETIYSMSPNDVSNNYYIYNKGNITYTGMGHATSQINGNGNSYTEANCTLNEAKLFINTMIAAYNAGIKPPSVSIQESAVEGAPKQTVLYRYYDDDFALDAVDSAADPYEEVYFNVRDVNFVKGSRNLSVKVYYDVPAGTEGAQSILVDGVSRNVKALDCPIYHAQTNAQVDPANLESGGIYYVQVPKNILQDCDGGLNLYFEAQSIISSNNKVYQTDKVYATLEVLKTYLFDLD